MTEHSKKHLNLIQAYRGIAAVLVLLAHVDLIFNQNLGQNFLAKVLTFGGSGVDFFFVLSGFIIFFIHVSDIGRRDKLKQFLIKRFVRVYPIYWVILTSKLSVSWFLSYTDANERSVVEVLKSYLLFPQDRKILSDSFLGVSWTLRHEVFFYLMFALLIGLSLKLSSSIIGIWLATSALNFLGIIPIPKDSLILQFIFSRYNLEFMFGCLAAYLVGKGLIKTGGQAFIFVGMFFYALAAINYYYEITNISSVIAFGIPSALLVLGAASLEMRKTVKVSYFLIFVGNASYSIYMMHGFFINNLTKILARLGPEFTHNSMLLSMAGLVIVAITLCLGCIFFYFIEKPLLSTLKPKFATA